MTPSNEATTQELDEARRRAEELDPFADVSEWLDPQIVPAEFDLIKSGGISNDTRTASIAILSAKVTLHAAVKQRQITQHLSDKADKTANRLFWATLLLAVATIALVVVAVTPFFAGNDAEKSVHVILIPSDRASQSPRSGR